MCSTNGECRYKLTIENQKSWELPIYNSNSNFLSMGIHFLPPGTNQLLKFIGKFVRAIAVSSV